MDKNGNKCVFFDRDGIVNESPGPGRYVESWEDFHLTPGFVESLRVAERHGYLAAIVTNQRAVARGLITIEELENIHRRLARLLAGDYSLELLDIAYCPHAEDECSCRKPRPGMLLELARKHGLNLKASWMIGDSDTDVEAGKQAGCRTILVGGKSRNGNADVMVPSMQELPDALESLLSKKNT